MRRQSKWAIEFNRQVKRLREKSKRLWYKHPQPSLKKLKATGQGNCLAWSHLSVEIAKMYGLKVRYITVWDRYKKDINTHQISLVYEKDGAIWYQSSIYINRLYKPRGKENFTTTKRRLCNAVAKDCG